MAHFGGGRGKGRSERGVQLGIGFGGEAAEEFSWGEGEGELPLQDAGKSGILLLLAGVLPDLSHPLPAPQTGHLQNRLRAVQAAAAAAAVSPQSHHSFSVTSHLHHGARRTAYPGYLY